MELADDIIREWRDQFCCAEGDVHPLTNQAVLNYLDRLERSINVLKSDRDNWRRQALDEDARANVINSAANTNVDAKVYSKSEMIEVLNKVHDFLGILIRENLIKEAPYLDEEPMLMVSDLADDLWEVIHKKLPCNNAAKMREALENSNGLLEELALIGEWSESAKEQIAENSAALAAPPRNCDIGTAEEQSVRMSEFCREQYKKTDGVALCSGCRFHGIEGLDCQFAWAQMPYKSEVQS